MIEVYVGEYVGKPLYALELEELEKEELRRDARRQRRHWEEQRADGDRQRKYLSASEMCSLPPKLCTELALDRELLDLTKQLAELGA